MSVRRLSWNQFNDTDGNPMFHAQYQVDQTCLRFWYGRSLDPDELNNPEAILPELDEAAAKVEFSNFPPGGRSREVDTRGLDTIVSTT